MITITEPSSHIRISTFPVHAHPRATFEGQNNSCKGPLIMFLALCHQVGARWYFDEKELLRRLPDDLTPGYMSQYGAKLCKWKYLERRPKLTGKARAYEYRALFPPNPTASCKCERLLNHFKRLKPDKEAELRQKIIDNNKDIFSVLRPPEYSKVIKIDRDSIRPTISCAAISQLVAPVTHSKRPARYLAYQWGSEYRCAEIEACNYEVFDRGYLLPDTVLVKSESLMRSIWKDLAANKYSLVIDEETEAVEKILTEA